jgi:hypothetical protein
MSEKTKITNDLGPISATKIFRTKPNIMLVKMNLLTNICFYVAHPSESECSSELVSPFVPQLISSILQ